MRLWLGVMFLALVVPVAVSADIYRYIDRDGVTHYTNVQPRGNGWRKVYRSDSRGWNASQRRQGSIGYGDPNRHERYEPFVREAAALYQLPAAFIRAVMRVESNFYPDAVSDKGAMGLMQLMPATAASMGVVDPFDPRQNVLGGARFLRVLANRFNGDLVLTVAAYNAGQGAVERYRGVPPYRETRRYVTRVLTHYYEMRAATAPRPDARRVSRL